MPTPISNNPQFNEFIRFASGEGVQGTTVLGSRASDDGGGTMTIAAKSKRDFVGNIGRSATAKAENTAVRDLFKNSVLAVCHVDSVDELPEVVKTAMKLDDYDKGKPLTARRVLAVQTAVKQAEIEDLIAREMGIDVAGNKELRERIHAAVMACGTNEDAYSVLTDNFREVLFVNQDGNLPGDAVLRGESDVCNLLKGVADVAKSLRQTIGTRGAPRELFDAAKPFLVFQEVQDLLKEPRSCFAFVDNVMNPQGLFSNERLDISPIEDLQRSTTALNVHKAAQVLHEAIGSGPILLGPSSSRVQQLQANMLLTRLFPDKEDLRAIRRALQSENMEKLVQFYRDRSKAPDDGVRTGGDPMEQEKREILSCHYEHTLNQLKRALDQLCDGVSSPETPILPFEGSVEADFAPEVGQLMDADLQSRSMNDKMKSILEHSNRV